MTTPSLDAMTRGLQAWAGAEPDGQFGPASIRAAWEKAGRPSSSPERAKRSAGPEPGWMKEARQFIGLREYPGSRHNQQILTWWEKIKAPFRDDETPWCAGFVGGILETVGVKSTRSAAARSYSKSPDFFRILRPAQGAIVVFWRGTPDGWSGHVGFVAGVSDTGDIWVLGGNQGDSVSLAKFSPNRLVGYFWPKGIAEIPDNFPVRRYNAAGDYSKNEA